MPSLSQSLAAIKRLQTDARQSRQRRLLVLSGEREWACELLTCCTLQDSLWISDQAPANATAIERTQARQWLGRELDSLIYDAWAGFDPDALAAISGALVGGGLLVLVVPPLAEWPKYADPASQRLLVYPFQTKDISGRFIRHIIGHLQTDKNALLIEQNQAIDFIPADNRLAMLPEPMDDHCLTVDQSQAVKSNYCGIKGRSRRPLVIRSDRGREKSSALASPVLL